MMHLLTSIRSIALLIILIVAISSAQTELFKINKLNLIWMKAQHSLGSSKLKDLKNDLVKHEFDELTLKKMKAHNQDKDGLFEAAVRKRLLSIMVKYSLERYYDDIHPTIEPKLKVVKKDFLRELKPTFRDKKLDKLWKKAEQSSFTQEQLMLLLEEFQHQQDKLDEHYDTMNLIEQELDEKTKRKDSLDNSIESAFKDGSSQKSSNNKVEHKKASVEPNIKQALNEKYKDIKKDIDKLHKRIISGVITPGMGPFEEDPVNELWSAAIEANFTETELESLKEELEHYQVRIKKLKHFQVQLERDEIKSEKGTNPNGNLPDVNVLSPRENTHEETKHIRRRVKELSHKVEKIHRDLEKKIMKRDEL